MAAFVFPSSPSVGDVAYDNGVAYQWNGTGWVVYKPVFSLTYPASTIDCGLSNGLDTTFTFSATTPSVLNVASGGTGLSSLTSGYIPFGSGTNALGSSNKLFWDGAHLVVGSSASDYIGLRIKSGAATAGTIQWTDDPVTTELGAIIALNTGELRMTASSAVTIQTPSGSERMRIDSSGNVGIGGVPDINLRVFGTYSQIGAKDGTVDTRLAAVSSSTAGILGNYSNHDLVFYTNATERMRIATTGAITTSCTSNLGISSSVTAPGSPTLDGSQFFVINNTSGVANLTYGTSDSRLLAITASPALEITYRAYRSAIVGTDYVMFGTSSSGAERMRITSAGNVGIGTSGPGSKIGVVNGTAGLTAAVLQGVAGTVIVDFNGGGANYYDAAAHYFRNYAGTLLASISTALTGTGNRALYSDANGQLTNSSSDGTLKTNIAPIAYGLSDALRLNPISFNWRDTERFGAQKEIGFVAQEVERVIPEVVGVNADDTLSLDYPKLTAVLTKAIQELAAKVAALKEQING